MEVSGNDTYHDGKEQGDGLETVEAIRDRWSGKGLSQKVPFHLDPGWYALPFLFYVLFILYHALFMEISA